MKAAGRTCSVQPAENHAIQALPVHKYQLLILRGWCEILNPNKRAKIRA